MCCQEVMRVLGELVLGQEPAQAVDRPGTDDQQKQAANDLQDAVEAFENDADREGPVEQVATPEPVHFFTMPERRASRVCAGRLHVSSRSLAPATPLRDKIECCDVGWPYHREVPPIECGNHASAKSLACRDDGSVDRAQGQVSVGCHQLRDSEPVGRGNALGHEIAGREVSEEAHLGLRADSRPQ